MSFIPSWDNLKNFLNTDDFATPAITDSRRCFPVILEEQYLSHELGAYDINAAEPWATAKESDVAKLKKRDRLTITGIQYWLVHDPQPDGTGMSVLKLSRSQGDMDSGKNNTERFKQR